MAYVDTLRTFVRVFELGSMSAAARDQRISPAVASSRIAELERHLSVRLFNRTTRSLQPTEHGRLFYDGAQGILDAIAEAEATVADIARQPKGSIYVSAPLGIGKRFIAPQVPRFRDRHPEVDLRLRLSDRHVDVTGEGLDVAFNLGPLEDSSLRVRAIAECARVLCASPDYVARRGMPRTGEDLLRGAHDCLQLRFPGMREFQWVLLVDGEPVRFAVSGPFECDDGDVLTAWALDHRGIVNAPVFDVAEHLASGALVPVATDTPPTPTPFSCLYRHKRYQDPKVRLFIDFIVARCREELGALTVVGG